MCHILLILAAFFCAMQAEAAELVTITEENLAGLEVPDGKESDWIFGDTLLVNDKISAVVAASRPSRHANMTVRNVGGCVIDLTQREKPNDQLSCFYPGGGFSYKFVGAASDGGEALDSGPRLALQGDSVSLQLRADAEAGRPQVDLTYTLREGDDCLQIATRYSNPNPDPISVEVRDLVRADRTFVSGADQRRNVIWWDDVFFEQTYAIIPVGCDILFADEPVEKPRPVRAPVRYDVGKAGAITLKPGQDLLLRRQLFPTRNLLNARSRAAAIAGEATASLRVSVRDPAGPVAGATVELSEGRQVYASGRTAADGHLVTMLPTGKEEWRFTAKAVGRGVLTGAITAAELAAGAKVLELGAPGTVVANVTDSSGQPIPCKVQFRPRSDPGFADPKTRFDDPDFGPDSTHTAVKNLVYSHNGRFRQPLTPGDYDAVVSYGTEYDVAVIPLTIVEGQETPLRAELRHSVDTTGWVSGEFHSHASPSGDNTTSQFGRVQNLLCEQIEFAPCTEHNRISSYQPHLERLESTHLMATCSGMELTGKVLRVNHQNAFPLIERRYQQDGGGPTVNNDSPIAQIERLALWDDGSEKLLQMNHPNLPQILGDRDLDGKLDAGFEKMFGFVDVIEVHPPAAIFSKPATVEAARKDLNGIFNWLQMLNLGYRLVGVVNTDAHYTFHGSGWLRNYIKSSTDNPAEIDTLEMVRASQQGHLVMTNGPFLEVEASAAGERAGPGDDLQAANGGVSLRVRVQCPNWFDIDRVQLFVNGRPAEEFNFTRRSHGELFSPDTVQFDHRFQVSLESDAHLVVAAIGEESSLGVVMGPDHAADKPVAVANPIFVDFDGNGFEANGDLLDLPIPHQQQRSPHRHSHPHR